MIHWQIKCFKMSQTVSFFNLFCDMCLSKMALALPSCHADSPLVSETQVSPLHMLAIL